VRGKAPLGDEGRAPSGNAYPVPSCGLGGLNYLIGVFDSRAVKAPAGPDLSLQSLP
jgi:hypothetical protein